MNKLLKKEYLVSIIFIFYMVSIILDFHIFYNSIITLIRCFVLSLLFIIIYFKYANKKEKKYLLMYFLLMFIYIIFHLISTSNFTNKQIEYNVVNEVCYFIKMSMNVVTIFIIFKLQLSKKRFYQIVSWSAFIVSFIIIITNIFKISYTSYDFNLIQYTIFDWFKYDNLSFLVASSKGLFHLTNQIVAILILYLPILFVYLKEKINIWKIINIILVILSLFMLGTRISTYSIIIIIIIVLFVYIIMSILNKKFDIKYFIILVILLIMSSLIYPYSPIVNRNKYYNDLYHEDKIIANTTTLNEQEVEVNVENKFNSLKRKLETLKLTKEFYLNYYPLENDYEFYINYINNDIEKVLNVRNLELSIIRRVKDLNNNKMDDYFGIGYDRIINIFNIEIDYVMQYYSVGILGILFTIFIYIFIVIYLCFKIIFNLKRYFKYDNLILLFSISIFLMSAYFTGNILNSISCIIPISFVIGYYLSSLNNQKEENEYYLGLKPTLLTKKEILDSIFKEKNQIIVFNINPLICLNFRNNKEIKTIINEQKYNIPDGNGIVLASILTSNNIKNSIPGIELMEELCKKSIDNNYSIYLYGAKEDSVKKTKINLEKKYKNIKIIGYTNGYEKESVVLKDILNKKPDILFVALGNPKQEEFIINNRNIFKKIKIIMPVGGSFDVLSGNLKRAPRMFIRLKLEWLYRMIKEPKRFIQIFKLGLFILLVLFRNFCYNEEK